MDKLSKEQRRVAMQIINTENHCFLTGKAGVGKTTTLRTIIEELKTKYKNSGSLTGANGFSKVVVTAMTGIAATNFNNATTLHSFAGIGLDGKKHPSNIYKMHWTAAEVLIIDEVSMLTASFFDNLFKWVKQYRVRLILCGDLLQLPPIGGDYFFNSRTWKRGKFEVFVLRKVIRQNNIEFINALEELRNGKASKKTLKYLLNFDISKCKHKVNENTMKLYVRNVDVHKENMKKLEEIDSEKLVCIAKDKLEFKDTVIDPNKTNVNFDRQLDKLIPKKFEYKIGAEVMLIKNMNSSLVNGSRGKVKAIRNKDIIVDFHSPFNIKDVPIPKHDFEYRYNDYRATRTQYPLKLAWALTTHKCQGMTLDNVLIDVNGAFATGQIYVGVSRVVNPDNLIINNIKALKKGLKVCPRAKKFIDDSILAEEKIFKLIESIIPGSECISLIYRYLYYI